jgi:hypothetical protein
LSKLTDTNKEWLLSFVSGATFYDKKCKDSQDTETLYISRIVNYCFNVGKNPDELIKLKPTQLELAVMLQKGVNAESINENAAEDLLENFLRQDTYFGIDKNGKKEERKFTESSKIGVREAVKSFYKSTRGRSLVDDVGDFIEAPQAKKRTPKVEDCLKLEEAMTTDRDKFLVWFLESCPVRKGTLRQLKFGDLKPLSDTEVPYWLRVEAKRLKGGGKKKYKKAVHVGFLHYYAVQKFEAYKQELKQKGIEYNNNTPLFVSYKTTPHGKKGDKMINLYAVFIDASDKAFKGEKRFSAHDMRDIISTVLLNPKVKANTNLTKPLTSHVPVGIEATYENPDDSEDKPNSELLEVFKSCIPFLVPETIPELKVEINEQKAENQKHQTQLEEQNRRIEELTNTVDKLVEYTKKGIHPITAKPNEQLRFISQEDWDGIQSIKDEKLRKKAIEELEK